MWPYFRHTTSKVEAIQEYNNSTYSNSLHYYILLLKICFCNCYILAKINVDEGEVAVLRAKSRPNRVHDPCHDAQMVGSYHISNPLCVSVLATMPEDYTTAPQHLLLKAALTWSEFVKFDLSKQFLLQICQL